MKKVGILTFHKPINYGAFLQAYSLCNNLNRDCKWAKFETIDYVAPMERNRVYINLLWGLKHFGVGHLRKDLAMRNAFMRSYKFLTLSNPSFSEINDLFKYCDETYDAIIIGSDAVFNWNQNGFPTAFIPLYDFKKCRLFSYAASVHGLLYKEEKPEKINCCHEAFKKMQIIGTRDYCTEQFVKYCSPDSTPIHCCDPTLLLDSIEIEGKTNNLRERIIKKYNFNIDKPFIVTMIPDETVSKLIYDTYKDKYSIITLFKHNDYCDFFLYDLDPFEWATVLNKADLVVTSYFHGALLSLVQNTPVVVIDLSKYNCFPYEGKLKDLLERRFSIPEIYFEKAQMDKPDVQNRFIETTKVAINGGFNQRIKEGVKKEQLFYRNYVRLLDECLN